MQHKTSRRRSSVATVATNPAFRLGFKDRREGRGFSADYETQNARFQVFYEWGRLFAASPASAAVQHIPSRTRDLTRDTLIALNAAHGYVFTSNRT